MFSKALLPLAVCFQALRTGNSAEYVEKIKGGWQMGTSVDVMIKTYKVYPLLFLGPQDTIFTPHCKIEFQDKKGDIGDCLLVSFSWTDSRVVINSYVNKKWKNQDNYPVEEIISPIYVTVKAEEKGFNITYEDNQYFREYEFPLKNIKKVKIVCPEEIKIKASVDIEDE